MKRAIKTVSPRAMTLVALLAIFCSCSNQHTVEEKISTLLKKETIIRAENALMLSPITVTASRCERSAGGAHDFYSEGDYWWPNPENPEGPYIRRDGQSNPDNFADHRLAMIRMSQLVGDLTSAYLLTGDTRYTDAALVHIRTWFTDETMRMNPNLLYAQAIKGVATGRGIGIIDTIHLIEVAQALRIMEREGVIDEETLTGSKQWFSDYLAWMSTHPYGMSEMKAKNNHGTCWVMQAAAFALYTGDEGMTSFCRQRFKEVLLPNQMAADGSFPLEMERTKPYSYALFNLDAMATICHLLSTEQDNLWNYTTKEGRNIQLGISFIYPYVENKSTWPLQPDVMYWKEWPVAQPSLLFSILNKYNEEYYKTWAKLEHFPNEQEVIRNLPVRHPLLWLR